MTAESEKRLLRLEDIEEIKQLIARYAKAALEGGGGGEDTWIGGWYESDFRKENGGWLFSKTELMLKLLSATSKPDWETPIPPWQG